jgi:geranylgeranyl pyrophosphate synthase
VRTAFDSARAEIAGAAARTESACVSDLDALLAGRFDDPALRRLTGPRAAALPRWMLARSLFGPAATFLATSGKQLRTELVTLGWTLGGGADEVPAVLAETVELLHAGALIVDDIEDGARTRRGRRTLHRTVGVPVALNVGNWLYFWPLERLARLDVAPATALALQRRVVHAVSRCHVGQALDLRLRPTTLARNDVPAVVRAISELKTGSLTELAVALGAIAAGAGRRRTAALARFGHRLGVGVQMLNDLADLGAAGAHRATFHDLRAGRVTWPWAWLARSATEATYRRLRSDARAVLRDRSSPARLGRELRTLVAEHGRRAATHWLASAVTSLRAATGTHRAIDQVMERLRAYDG